MTDASYLRANGSIDPEVTKLFNVVYVHDYRPPPKYPGVDHYVEGLMHQTDPYLNKSAQPHDYSRMTWVHFFWMVSRSEVRCGEIFEHKVY